MASLFFSPMDCFFVVIFFLQKHLYSIYTKYSFGDNMTDKITTMQVHESTLRLLHEHKGFKQSYEDVVLMLLQNYTESNNKL